MPITPQPQPEESVRLPLRDWLCQAEGLAVVELRFEVEATLDVALRHPLNAMLRGVMGQQLRAMRCLTGADSCEGCEQWSACDYATLFRHNEVAGSQRHSVAWRLCGGSLQRRIRKGQRLSVTIELDVQHEAMAPWAEIAMRSALLRALGEGSVRGPATKQRKVFAIDENAGPVTGLHFISPCDVGKVNQRDRGDCPNVPLLPRLMRATVRRVAGRMDAAGRAFERVAYPELRRVALEENALTFWRDKRYSHRQNKELNMTGVSGSIRFLDPLDADLSALCDAMRFFGVGSDLVVGLGDVQPLRVG